MTRTPISDVGHVVSTVASRRRHRRRGPPTSSRQQSGADWRPFAGRFRWLHLGIAHHLGWAVAITATADHHVADRRTLELIEPGVETAPIHHVGGPHQLHRAAEPFDDDALAGLVADVRASAVRASSTALDELAAALPEPITSMSLRSWPADFPDDIAVQRRVPYESRADSVMYRQVLAQQARERGWVIHLYDAKTVRAEAARILGEHATEVLREPRRHLGPPWTKDHQIALAAAIVSDRGGPSD